MSEDSTKALPKGKPVLRVMPEQRMPPGITVGMSLTILDTETKNGTTFVHVRFNGRQLAHWIPKSCIMASPEEAAA